MINEKGLNLANLSIAIFIINQTNLIHVKEVVESFEFRMVN